jgi:hypothetical protein
MPLFALYTIYSDRSNAEAGAYHQMFARRTARAFHLSRARLSAKARADDQPAARYSETDFLKWNCPDRC